MRDAITGVILAGGKSRRMGRDKAWIELDGKPLVAHVIERLGRVSERILVIANDPTPYAGYDVQVVPDAIPGAGSLGGIYSGLLASKTEYVIAVACDMPFLNTDLVSFLVSQRGGYDVVIPSTGKPAPEKANRDSDRRQPTAKDFSLHPLHAVYTRKCIEPIRQAIAREDLRMIGFHDQVRVKIVPPIQIDQFDPEHLSFWNLNNPEELARARREKER